MKYLILSDLHGSAYWCRRALETFRTEQADRLLLLGDILYHGPRNDLPDGYAPKEVIALLNPLASTILCVRGNCEAEVDQMVLDFPVLADYALMELSGHLLYLTHGHRYNAKQLPPLHPGDVLLHGHTHIPCKEQVSGVWVLNPGSAALPKQGSHHGYMTLEEGLFLWKDFDGQILDRLELS